MTQVIGEVQGLLLVMIISKSYVRRGGIYVTSKSEEGISKSNSSQSCRNVTVPQNNNLVNEGVY